MNDELDGDASEGAKAAGPGRLQIRVDFLLKSDRFGAISASGKPGADLGVWGSQKGRSGPAPNPC